MGSYYLWLGTRTYLRTGGLGVDGATAQAVIVATTQAVIEATEAIPTRTSFPTFTPIPPCEDWLVDVPSAIVRRAPTVNSAVVETFNDQDVVCVIEQVGDTDWYLIDVNANTQRIEEGYMRNDIIRPLNPTPTLTRTTTPLPTVTPPITATRPQSAAPTVPPAALATITPTPTESATP